MKRIIDNEITTLEIVVEVFHDVDTKSIAASSIKPIYTPEGELDEAALDDYYAFVEQVECYLENAGLEIIDYEESKASKTSFYYTLADSEQYANGNMRYIIFLRVSDHTLRLRPDQAAYLRQKREDKASNLHVRYKLRRILVNGNAYDSYDQACDEVCKRAEEFKEALR